MNLLPFLIITSALLIAMVYAIYQMIKTGRKKAIGSKERRRKLLPFIYNKKK